MEKLYEGLFLLDANEAARSWSDMESHIGSLLTKNEAKLAYSERWSDRKLAYPVDGVTKGTYYLTYFTVPAEKVGELRRDVQLSEKILRLMVVHEEYTTLEMNKRQSAAAERSTREAVAAEEASAAPAATDEAGAAPAATDEASAAPPATDEAAAEVDSDAAATTEPVTSEEDTALDAVEEEEASEAPEESGNDALAAAVDEDGTVEKDGEESVEN